MAMTRQTRPFSRIILAATALVTATMLSTCGFLTSDTFPRWLSYVEASVDFRAIAVAQGLGSDAYIENLEFAPYLTGGTDYSKVLVFATGNGTSRLILLDPDKLSFSFAASDSTFGRSLASVVGGFMSGTAVLEAISSSHPIIGHFPNWTESSSVKVFRFGDELTGYHYASDQFPTHVGADFREYDSSWSVTANIASRNWDSLSRTYQLLDSEAVNGMSVLARRSDNGEAYSASFPTANDFTHNTILRVFDDILGIATITGPFPVADDKAWLTADGPIAYYRDKNNRIIRYRWGTGDFATGARAEELDSLLFDDDDMQLLSFDPSGTWWFVYDKLSGRLYKLRTWWK